MFVPVRPSLIFQQEANASECFEVDTLFDTLVAEETCGGSLRYQSVIGYGKGVFVEEPEEKRIAWGIIARHYKGTDWELSANRIKTTAVIRVDIQRLIGKASGF